jgi:hypothetical protein
VVDGKTVPPEAMLEVKDVPLQAGLDLLRTVRGGFAPGIEAKGAVNGSLTYKEAAPAVAPKKPLKRKAAEPLVAEPAGNLQGTLTVDGAEFSGGELKDAVKLPQVKLTPALVPDLTAAGGRSGLTGRLTIPAATPAGSDKTDGMAQAAGLQIGLTAEGYQAVVTGTAGIGRLRELAYAVGWPHLDVVDGFAAGTADFSVTAQGPWVAEEIAADTGGTASAAHADSLSGALTLHHAEWHAAYLALPVEWAQATVTLADGVADFAGDFAYGNGKDAAKEPVRGSATIHARAECVAGELEEECLPQVELRFGAQDAAVLEAALLGSPEKKSLLSPLMDRMRSTDHPKWPAVALRVDADSLALGPMTLLKPVAEIRFAHGEVAVKHWQAGLLGGTAEGTGSFAWVDDKPQYGFDGSFTHVSAVPLGALVGSHWTGGPVSGTGSLQLGGRSAADLTASAAGTLHFDWQHGAGLVTKELTTVEMVFDDWSGTATIQGGKVVLGENTMLARRKSSALAGSIPFAGPVDLTVAPAAGGQAAGSPAKQAVK